MSQNTLTFAVLVKISPFFPPIVQQITADQLQKPTKLAWSTCEIEYHK